MKRLISVIAVLMFPAISIAENVNFSCQSKEVFALELFSLKISRYFRGDVEFKLCHIEKSDTGFLLVRKSRDRETFTNSKVDLSKSEYEELVNLYSKSLDFNVKDSSSGLHFDGETWCLDTNRGDLQLKACFWVPNQRMSERNTYGVYSLGKQLWSVTNIEKEYGEVR